MAEAIEQRSSRALWLGLLFTVLGVLSNGLYFVGFPAVAVVWISLAFPVIGLFFLLIGLRQAVQQPNLYRGKIWRWIVTGLSALVLLASVAFFLIARRLPVASVASPQVGQRVPDFTLPDSDGHPASLSQLLAGSGKDAAPKSVLLVFYRGYW
jgi:hypothetical protein